MKKLLKMGTKIAINLYRRHSKSEDDDYGRMRPHLAKSPNDIGETIAKAVS